MSIESETRVHRLESLDGLELRNVEAELVEFKGRRAVRLVEGGAKVDGHAIAILAGSDFRDGTIEADISGGLLPGAPGEMRGFVGIAFRVQPDGAAFECFYLRPTNGRADDQLRRNHATQYISHPDAPWYTLREQHPGVYESYADMLPSEWTKVKVVVSGGTAHLHVGGADQPCLIVNDLRLGETSGAIALWIGFGTEAHFSEIVVSA
jgi:hypothetical protein